MGDPRLSNGSSHLIIWVFLWAKTTNRTLISVVRRRLRVTRLWSTYE